MVKEICRQNGVVYSTPSKLCESFARLEEELLHVSSILSSRITLHGLDFRHVPEPKSFGYCRLHKTARYALRAIYQSCDAVVMLMAWISHLFTVFDRCLVDSNGAEPDYRAWENILCDAGIPQDRVHMLKSSEINDFTPAYLRAGVFVKYDNWSFHQTMNICIKYNIPVWVYWVGECPFRPARLMEDHLFTAHELDATFTADREMILRRINEENEAASELAVDLAKSIASGSTSVPNIPDTATVVTNTTGSQANEINFPIPNPDSCQKLGETPIQFIQHMMDAHVHCIASETVAQC